MKIRLQTAVGCALLAVAVPSLAAASAFSGTVQATFWIGLGTAVPTGYEVDCVLSLSVLDGASGVSYEETAFITATMAGTTPGSAGYCTVAVPYEWQLANQATDQIQVSYTIEMVPTSLSSASVLKFRSTGSNFLGQIAVPGNKGSASLGPLSVRL
jgi:hypothetical protein